MKDIVSFVFIFLSVVLIALGAEKRNGEHKEHSDTQAVTEEVDEALSEGDVKYYFILAIITSLLYGLVNGFNAW